MTQVSGAAELPIADSRRLQLSSRGPARLCRARPSPRRRRCGGPAPRIRPAAASSGSRRRHSTPRVVRASPGPAGTTRRTIGPRRPPRPCTTFRCSGVVQQRALRSSLGDPAPGLRQGPRPRRGRHDAGGQRDRHRGRQLDRGGFGRVGQLVSARPDGGNDRPRLAYRHRKRRSGDRPGAGGGSDRDRRHPPRRHGSLRPLDRSRRRARSCRSTCRSSSRCPNRSTRRRSAVLRSRRSQGAPRSPAR